jgi:hypothetical protein
LIFGFTRRHRFLETILPNSGISGRAKARVEVVVLDPFWKALERTWFCGAKGPNLKQVDLLNPPGKSENHTKSSVFLRFYWNGAGCDLQVGQI